jgi:hypothetical protein
MQSAASHLDSRRAEPAATDQQSAIDELEKIWEAVIPFHALLARDLADQTMVTQALAPAPPGESKSGEDEKARKKVPPQAETKPSVKAQSASTGSHVLGSQREDLEPLTESEQRTLRRTQLLKPKAEAELERLETAEASGAPKQSPGQTPGKTDPPDAGDAKSKPVDPKEVKAGYKKAIELAPKAVEQMERAVKSLKQKDAQAAYKPAEEARKILEEIQKAQPKQDQQDQKQQDQNKKKDDQQKQEQKDQQKKDEQKKDQQKDSRENKDQPKKEQEKKDEERKKQEQQKEPDEKKQDQKQQQVSRDRVEEAMRKVRERQQEKRDRDRQMKVRVYGRAPVEKDW